MADTDKLVKVGQLDTVADAVIDVISNTNERLGNLSNLETEDKSNIVNAINEAAQSGGSGSGLTDDIKVSLLACFDHVAWSEDDPTGKTYIDALREALYPPANLISISAVYTQSGTVYDNQTLDSLRANLVVTARYDDRSTQTVTSYTLSGTLATGTSTITVAYGGKTATFNVIVTHATAQYSITNTLTNCTNSNSATTINEETAYSATLTAISGYIMSTVTITMSGTDITSTAYDSETGAISIASVTGNIVITAEAIEDVGWISGVPYENEWSAGGYSLERTTGNVVTSTNDKDHVSSLLPCRGASAISLINANNYICFYDESESFITYGASSVSGFPAPYHAPVPRNAYYMRFTCRQSDPSISTATPHLFPKLTESTVYQFNTYYNMEFESDADTGVTSGYGLLYGATKLQTSMYARSWIDFYDAEKSLISTVTRQNTTTEIDIPEGAYYCRLRPNGNINPWVMLVE